MKKTQTITFVSALALSLFVVWSASAAPGFGGGMGWWEKGQGHWGEMVTKHAEHTAEREENKAQLETVVAANDFDGFVVLRAEHKAEMEERAAAEWKELKEREDRPEREEPTDEEMRAHFDEMVAYYNENGELPEPEMRMNKTQGKKVAGVAKKARKGWLSDGQRDRVQTVVNNIEDTDRLENILEKISTIIETLASKDIEEERKETILGTLETIQAMIEAKLA